MKFQFNFEGYRNDLAGTLKEKRKESRTEAREMIKEEKSSPKYELSKHAKNLINDEKKLESAINATREVFDISAIIPEEIKLYLDATRMKELNSSFDLEKHTPKNLNEIAENFVNDITNGAYLDSKHFNHILKGLNHSTSKTFDTNLTENKVEMLSTNVNEVGFKRYSKLVPSSNNYAKFVYAPKDSNNDYENTEILNNEIWLASGKNTYFDVRKPVIILDPYSNRFQEHVVDLKDNNGKRIVVEKLKNSWEEKFDIDQAISIAKNDPLRGVLMKIDKYCNSGLRAIAEYIIDLPRGQMIHYTENKPKKQQ